MPILESSVISLIGGIIIGIVDAEMEYRKFLKNLIQENKSLSYTPIFWEKTKIGDCLYVKIKDKYISHIISDKDEIKGVFVSNKYGLNDWTQSVYVLNKSW